MTDVVERLVREDPKFHSGGARSWSALPGLLKTIGSLVGEDTHTLETGCGASTVVFASGGGRHTTISPDPREHELVQGYCRDNAIDHSSVTFMASPSDEVLPGLLQGRVLDLAFIDGAHAFPFAIVDWHFLSRNLKIGGHMFVDDIAIPAIAPLFRFMSAEDCWQLEELPDNRAALFRLVSEPPPEDYTLQKFNNRMDYSFAPAFTRAQLTGQQAVQELRMVAGRRLPRVRDAYRRWKHER